MPRWNLDSLFPSLDGPETVRSFAFLDDCCSELESLLADAEAGKATAVLSVERLLVQLNSALEETAALETYLYCLVTTDSRNEAAQAKLSVMEGKVNRLGKARTRFSAWVGKQDIDALVAASELAQAHEFALRKAKIEAEHQMSPAEEVLASDLLLSGGLPWAKLHGNITSQLKVTVNLPDGSRVMPMSAVRNLAYDADREIRRVAYESELSAWASVEVPLAAAMNGVKGELNTLTSHRGWTSPLALACHQAHIDEPTLEAMMSAAQKAFPTIRRYLKAKAKMIGLQRLAWYDLFAPLQGEGRSYPWPEAVDFIENHFRGYSDRMADYAVRNFKEAWIDVPAVEGKVDGAYCSAARRDESRILLNYSPDFKWVSTLAHELGHAYHNHCLYGRTEIQKETPMTLAETASIFCETIVKRAVMSSGSAEERRVVLEASLMGSTQVVVDITSRFLFERGAFELRKEREVSATELSELMRTAQLGTYGDGVDSEFLHPYMWAAKPHYYSAGTAYYNFPYMFGLLFGLGLYRIYENEPDGFHARYDDLLASTGLADAATLADRFGIDIRDEAFWAGSLAVIEADVAEFERLA